MNEIVNPGGRPSKYNDDLQDRADQYIYSLDELGHTVPSRAGLCCFLGIVRSTCYEWEKVHPKFSDTLASIDVMQEHLALNGGLTGRLNSTIVKLVLANHGYSERQQIDHSSTDGSMATLGKRLDDFYKEDDV